MDKFYIIPDSGQGGLIDISDNVFYAIGKGMKGHGMPPQRQSEVKLPVDPGAVHKSTEVRSRQVLIPLYIGGSTPAEFNTKFNDLVVATYDQEFVFRITRDGMAARDLYCRYVGGLDGSGMRGQTWLRTVLVVVAFDPFWYATSEIQRDYGIGSPVASLPWPPIEVSPSSLADNIVENNPGDVLAWPIWEIKGPITKVQVNHDDLSKTFEVIKTLILTDYIDIDTTTLQKTVIDRTSGLSIWDLVTTGGEMFPILPGPNNMSVSMFDADATSNVRLRYTPRYLRA